MNICTFLPVTPLLPLPLRDPPLAEVAGHQALLAPLLLAGGISLIKQTNEGPKHNDRNDSHDSPGPDRKTSFTIPVRMLLVVFRWDEHSR